MKNLNDEGLDTPKSKKKMSEYMNFQTPSDIAEEHYINSGQADADYEDQKKMMEEGEVYGKMFSTVIELRDERNTCLKQKKEMRLLSFEEQDFLFQMIEDLEYENIPFFSNSKEVSIDKKKQENPVLSIQYESDIKPEDLPF